MLASLKLNVWGRELGLSLLQCTVLTEDHRLAVPRANCTLWENGQRFIESTFFSDDAPMLFESFAGQALHID